MVLQLHEAYKNTYIIPKVMHEFTKKICIRFDVPRQAKAVEGLPQLCLDIPNLLNDYPRIITDKLSTHSLQGFTLYIKTGT